MNGIFHRSETNNPKICMETQKTLNNQCNLKKEEQYEQYCVPWFQTMRKKTTVNKQYGTGTKTDT